MMALIGFLTHRSQRATIKYEIGLAVRVASDAKTFCDVAEIILI